MRVASILNSGADTEAWLGEVCMSDSNHAKRRTIIRMYTFCVIQQSLSHASQCGHIQVVRLLISRGANLDSRDKVCGFLRSIFVHGRSVRPKCCQGLQAAHKLLILSITQDGWTSLMFAAVRGKCEDVEEFLSEGANVNAQNNVHSSIRSTGI